MMKLWGLNQSEFVIPFDVIQDSKEWMLFVMSIRGQGIKNILIVICIFVQAIFTQVNVVTSEIWFASAPSADIASLTDLTRTSTTSIASELVRIGHLSDICRLKIFT